MADESIIRIARKYLHELLVSGFEDCYVVLFGSQATGTRNDLSDIDLLVVSSIFDGEFSPSYINTLWHVAARVDSRIEPIPAGKRQYDEDDSSAIIEVARRKGEIITPAA